jgi:hypothetical protein
MGDLGTAHPGLSEIERMSRQMRQTPSLFLPFPPQPGRFSFVNLRGDSVRFNFAYQQKETTESNREGAFPEPSPAN